VSTTIIRNGRIIDPANKRDEVADLAISNGKIVEKPQVGDQKAEEIDAKGLIVAPGLIDIHVHLREPGFGHKETIAPLQPADSRRLFACRTRRRSRTARQRSPGLRTARPRPHA
jgi:imidazolonepropionase-like amidohydrolase